jgi:hypothetical protein
MTYHAPFLCAVLLLLANCSNPPPEQSAATTHFVELGVEAGLIKSHTGGGPEKGYIVEAKGGGSALVDFDNDGNLDIYWVNGATFADLQTGAGNVLYRNAGDATFTDVTATAGVAGRGWGMGAVSADYDNDGRADLYITCLQDNILYHNNGDGTFDDVSIKAGVTAPNWSAGAAFGDYDHDGDLDLYVAHYVTFDSSEVGPLSAQWKGVDVFSGPLGLVPAADVFYRNNGDATFDDATQATGLTAVAPGYGLGVLFTDFDDDGDADLYVANDSTPNFLFRNNGDGSFDDVALQAGVAFGEMGNAQAGMGVTRGDYDGDGHIDLLVTNFEDDYNTLYRDNGDGTFADVTFAVGLGRSTLAYVGFGTGFFDADNDGDLDLLVANGHVYPQIDAAGSGSTYAQPNFLFENRDSKFTLLLPQQGDSLGTSQVSRGAGIGDFDGDGDLDLFITNLNARPVLLRNEFGNRHNWLNVQLAGTGANRDAIGARIYLFAAGHRQVREVLAGSSFLGSADRRQHFGLGTATQVDSLQVHWPGGQSQTFRNLPINTSIHLVEDHSTWQTVDPRPQQ